MDPLLAEGHEWREPSISIIQDLATKSSGGVWERGEHVASIVGMVQSGAFAIERLTADGRRVLCALFHAGDLVDVRHHERRQPQVLTALTKSTLIEFDEQRFDSCIATHSDIAKWVNAQLCEQTERLCDHALDLACKTPTEKVASVLLEFRRWPECLGRVDSSDAVYLPISRRDISDYIGIRPETLSRCLRALESELLIRILSRRRILLSNVASLDYLASGGRPRHSTRST
jgi:CRP/FNR family transcriptional regulator